MRHASVRLTLSEEMLKENDESRWTATIMTMVTARAIWRGRGQASGCGAQTSDDDDDDDDVGKMSLLHAG